MFDLFDDRGDELRVYLWRRPKADGGSPSFSRVVAAAVIVAVTGIVVADSFAFLWRNPAKLAVYLLLITAATAFIVSQFAYLSITLREIHLVFPGYRRRLADLTDLLNIRIARHEYDGLPHFCYIAIWRKDPYMPPLRLSPVCRSMNRLSHYQRTVIPRIRERIVLASPPDKIRPEERDFPATDGKAVVRGSFRVRVFARVAAVGLALLGFVLLIQTANFGMADADTYSLFALVLPVIKPICSIFALIRFAVELRRGIMRNTATVIDGRSGTITVTAAYGLDKRVYTFEDARGIAVRGFGGRREICLLLEGCDIEPIVTIVHSTPELRREVRKICALLRVPPWDFVDLLSPGHEWRFNSMHNPYREWDHNHLTYKLAKRKRGEFAWRAGTEGENAGEEPDPEEVQAETGDGETV